MADPARHNSEMEPLEAPEPGPHAWLVRRMDDFHAAAEARTKPVASPRKAIEAFKRRFAELGSVVPLVTRSLAEGLVQLAGDTDDSDPKLPTYIRQMQRTEAQIDLFHASRRLLPDFFRTYRPRELAAALRDGVRHPRYLAETLLRQNQDMRDGRTPVSPDDVLRDALPESLRPAYAELASDRVPKKFAAAARTVGNHLSNRAYPQAIRAVETLIGSWQDASQGVRDLPKILVELERNDRVREERLFAMQAEAYGAMIERHPERRAEIERRRRTEEIFRNGNLVGEVVPLLPSQDHSGAPFKVTLEYEGETRVGIVKFAFAERYAREGVTPGNGHWREVAGAMHAFAFGLEAPAVVARRTEGFGEVTVMELLDGRSCNLEDGWFLGEDGMLRPELGAMAIEEYLKFRTDGAPRNNMRTADGRTVPVDHGSDMPSDPDVAMSSVALYLMSDSGETVSRELQDRVRSWAVSPERRVFRQMVLLFPEDMGRYLAACDARLDALIATFDRGVDPLFPRYRPIDHTDFGTKFMDDYEDFQLAQRQPRAPAPDVTVPQPRNV